MLFLLLACLLDSIHTLYSLRKAGLLFYNTKILTLLVHPPLMWQHTHTFAHKNYFSLIIHPPLTSWVACVFLLKKFYFAPVHPPLTAANTHTLLVKFIFYQLYTRHSVGNHIHMTCYSSFWPALRILYTLCAVSGGQAFFFITQKLTSACTPATHVAFTHNCTQKLFLTIIHPPLTSGEGMYSC
jgi:hypothetical protein